MRTPLLAALVSTGLAAQSVVVPNANATTLGTGQLNTLLTSVGASRTYQYGINASELAAVPVGAVITGVSLRFMVYSFNPASWPSTDLTWTHFDIYAGPAILTSTWVADPAINFASPPQQVRSGPLVLDHDSFTNPFVAGTPNPWSEFYFDFQQPYVYTGGDLALLFSHTGTSYTGPSPYPETVVSNPGLYGVGRAQSVYPAGNNTTSTTFYVMRIHYGYGAGCASSSGAVPVLVQNHDLTGGTGGTIRLQAANVPPLSIVLFALGFNQVQVPLGGGCDLLTSPDFLLATLSNSNGRTVLNVPLAPGVSGNFFAQAALLDPGVPLGFCLTNGVAPTVN